MKGAAVAIAVVLFAAVGLGSCYVSQKNSLIQAEEQVNGAWSQVQNVYQRRMDLIPNLVETVKGVANFEKETYTQVAEARAKAGQVTISPDLLNDPNKFAQFDQTQSQLSAGLGRLMVVAEKYPELKANENFRDLQAQLEGTENRITVERKRFNDAVQSFNTKVRSFPTSMIAGMAGMQSKPYFQASAGAEQAPKVKF